MWIFILSQTSEYLFRGNEGKCIFGLVEETSGSHRPEEERSFEISGIDPFIASILGKAELRYPAALRLRKRGWHL
jgi:hypothetical protein